MNMVKLFKLIPILALVGGIGIALANQGIEDPCVEKYTQGYVKTDPLNPDPTLSPGEEITDLNMEDAGQFDVNFLCLTSNNECYWIYNPEHGQANPDGWIKCKGTHQKR